jgi:hypothetical protein
MMTTESNRAIAQIAAGGRLPPNTKALVHDSIGLARSPKGKGEPYALERNPYLGAMVRSVADVIISPDTGALCVEKTFDLGRR